MRVLTNAEREFPGFALGTFRGLYEATITHPDTFLYAVGAVLNMRTRTASAGRSLMAYVALRQIAESIGMTARSIDFLSRVVRDNPIFQQALFNYQNG